MSRHRSRKTSKTPAAQLVASNEDLLSEILLRLPVKSLFRFKCVSTEWTDLISSPYFSKHHTLRNPNSSTTGMILHHHPYLAYISLVSLGPARHVRSSFGPFPALDFLNIPPRFSSLTILGSSHGLLLGLLVASPMLAGDIDVIYIVCNPTTKQFRALPHIADMATRPIVNMDLAHDPSDSPSYKVVCTRSSSPINTTRAFDFQIFTPETGAWRACRRGPFDGIRPGMMFRGGVYSNKRIHFVDTLNEDSLYFDVRDETLKTLKMPSAKGEVVGSKRAWHVGESGGRVHLVDIETNLSRECSIGIYELAEDCSGWAMRWRVGLSAMERGFNEMFVQYVDAVPFLEGVDARVRVGRYYTYNVLGLVRKEDDELELVLSIPNKIVCYNPASGEWRVVVHFSDDRDRRGYDWHNVIRYVDTLAPV